MSDKSQITVFKLSDDSQEKFCCIIKRSVFFFFPVPEVVSQGATVGVGEMRSPALGQTRAVGVFESRGFLGK